MRKEGDNSKTWSRRRGERRRRDGGNKRVGEGSLCVKPEIDQRQT